MINTIFYYPDSLTFEEYQSKLGTDIAARTIVFADAQKAIYKGGKQFGATSLTDLKNQIQQIFNENPYTLPIATASRLGGIMIGDGFHIDANTGKLDVDFSGITNGTNGRNGLDGLIKTIFDSVTNIRASKNNYGIVKVGNGINVVDGVISVDFSNVDLSEIEGDITSLKASVALHTNAITDLTGRLSSAEATLTTKANASDVTSLSNRVGTTESTLTDLSAQTTLYARSLTNLTKRVSSAETGLQAKADASSVYSKSEIDGKISTINSVISNLSGGADIDLSAITDLENEIATVRASLSSKADASSVYSKSYIDDKFYSVETTLSTLGASSGVDTSAITDLINRISTAESTLQSKANASETYTKSQVDGLVSTLETSMITLGASGGISNTAITDLKNRMSSAETSISSKANASETYTKTEVDNKVTALTTRIDTLDASAGVDTSSITDLVNRIAAAEATLQSKADSSTTYTKTEIDGKITTINSSISANSGLKTAADVKSVFDDINETIYTSGTASATLFAKIESDADAKYAGIDVAVRKVNVGTSANPNYQLESGVTISADNINLNGQTWAQVINADAIFSDYMESITSNADGGSWSINYTNGLIINNDLNESSAIIAPGYLDIIGDGARSKLSLQGDTMEIGSSLYPVTLTVNEKNIAYSDANTDLITRDITAYGTLEFSDASDTTSLAYDGSDDELSCGANLSVSGNGYYGGNLRVNGTVAADNFVVQTSANTTASGWSGTIVADGNTLTFKGGILTAASGSGVTAAS